MASSTSNEMNEMNLILVEMLMIYVNWLCVFDKVSQIHDVAAWLINAKIVSLTA